MVVQDCLSFAVDLPVAGDYDVLVVGGGTAGSIAAIQAGRLGARVGLIEKNGILGGTMTSAAVNFPGLFHAWGRQVIAGIGWEAMEMAIRWGGAKLPDISELVPHQHWRQQIPVNRFILATILDELCVTAGVDLRLHEMVSAVQKEKNGLTVLITGKTGLKNSANKKLDRRDR